MTNIYHFEINLINNSFVQRRMRRVGVSGGGPPGPAASDGGGGPASPIPGGVRGGPTGPAT